MVNCGLKLWSETEMLIQLMYIYYSGKAWQIEANKSCNNNHAPYDPNLNFSVARIFCRFCLCANIIVKGPLGM